MATIESDVRGAVVQWDMEIAMGSSTFLPLIQISKSATYMGIRLGIIVLGGGCAGQGLIVMAARVR